MDSEVARFAMFTVPLTVILSSIYIGSFDKAISNKDAYGNRIIVIYILNSIVYAMLMKSGFDFRQIMILLGSFLMIMYFSVVIWSLISVSMKNDYESRNGALFVMLLVIGFIILYTMKDFLIAEISNSFSLS